MKEFGYANTTLRDIAAHSGLPLGSLSYYFTDKSDLITFCVRSYKQDFINRINAGIQSADGPAEILDRLAEGLAIAVTDERPVHKLWYDIRTQAMFDPTFRPVVDEIETNLIKTFANAARAAGAPEGTDISLGYAMIDGVFRYLMQNFEALDLDREAVQSRFVAILQKIL